MRILTGGSSRLLVFRVETENVASALAATAAIELVMNDARRIPIARKGDLIQAAGYLLVGTAGVLQPQINERLFDSWRKRYFSRSEASVRATAELMRAALGPYLPDSQFDELAREYHEMILEDRWLQWSLALGGSCQVEIETVGVEHLPVEDGVAAGNHSAAVIWSTSFCGSLVPKMALHRIGMPFTMLSSSNHGAPYPPTRFGNRVLGPVARTVEERFLVSRVLIPPDQSLSYMRRLRASIRESGFVCVAGERDTGRQRISAKVLGREMLYATGAPALALSHNVPLVPLFVKRLGPFHYRATIGEPVQADRTQKQPFVAEAIADYAARIERHLLQAPASWDWSNSRVINWARPGRPS